MSYRSSVKGRPHDQPVEILSVVSDWTTKVMVDFDGMDVFTKTHDINKTNQ